jgi:hypothetical protein
MLQKLQPMLWSPHFTTLFFVFYNYYEPSDTWLTSASVIEAITDAHILSLWWYILQVFICTWKTVSLILYYSNMDSHYMQGKTTKLSYCSNVNL